FEEKEDPQEEEEEDDMEVDIEEDENEPELTYPYEEVDSLNPPPPTSESELEDVTEAENPIKHKDETVPANVHEVGNEVRSSVEQGMIAMEKLVEKLSNAEDKADCKKLKKELEEPRGFMFKERPNEAINVPIEDEKSSSFDPRGSPHDA
nr:hypothetical protein [Tanacetum cinerariifolium]